MYVHIRVRMEYVCVDVLRVFMFVCRLGWALMAVREKYTSRAQPHASSPRISVTSLRTPMGLSSSRLRFFMALLEL